MTGAPGVLRVAMVRVVAEGTERQLRQVELAERVRARLAQAGHRGGVPLGEEVLRGLGAA